MTGWMDRVPEFDGREPETPEQWQFCVDSANALLVTVRAKRYGFITGGPKVNEARCMDVLKRGRELGYKPVREAIVEMAVGFSAKGHERELVGLLLMVHDEIDTLTTPLPSQANPRADSRN